MAELDKIARTFTRYCDLQWKDFDKGNNDDDIWRVRMPAQKVTGGRQRFTLEVECSLKIGEQFKHDSPHCVTADILFSQSSDGTVEVSSPTCDGTTGTILINDDGEFVDDRGFPDLMNKRVYDGIREFVRRLFSYVKAAKDTAQRKIRATDGR